MFSRRRNAASSPEIRKGERGSQNVAVPTSTATAPAIRNSAASSPLAIPPSPMTGIFTARAAWYTRRKAMGLMAGPESPPKPAPAAYRDRSGCWMEGLLSTAIRDNWQSKQNQRCKRVLSGLGASCAWVHLWGPPGSQRLSKSHTEYLRCGTGPEGPATAQAEHTGLRPRCRLRRALGQDWLYCTYMGVEGLPDDLERYRFIRVLGYGGLATVYLVEDIQSLRRGVMKVARAEPDTSAQARFHQEAAFLSRLHHPNIPALYDSGILADGRPFLVTEWVEGRVLAGLLESRIPISLQDVLSLAGAVASALSCAHQQKVLHLDVKPANILVPGREEGTHSKRRNCSTSAYSKNSRRTLA
jgi:Protein kinase domain